MSRVATAGYDCNPGKVARATGQGTEAVRHSRGNQQRAFLTGETPWPSSGMFCQWNNMSKYTLFCPLFGGDMSGAKELRGYAAQCIAAAKSAMDDTARAA